MYSFRKESKTHIRIWFKSLSIELVLLCFKFNLSAETNWSEREITFYIALPLIAIYFTVKKNTVYILQKTSSGILFHHYLGKSTKRVLASG